MKSVDKHEALSDSNPIGKRNWERLEYQVSLLLILSKGRRFAGITHDVSLGGTFIQTAHPPTNLNVGELGEAYVVNAQDSNLVFPCQVVRVAEEGVAIEFLGDHAAFGAFITHEMMLELLTRINNSFARSRNLEATLIIAVDTIKNYLQAEGASLFLIANNQKEVVCRASAGPVDITGLTLGIHEGIVGRSIKDKLLQTVHNVSQDANFAKKVDDLTGFTTQSIMCAPLIINGETIGALEVVNKRGTGLFAGHDQVVLTALSSATAMAINNARQAEELKTHRDKLEILVEQRTVDLVEANRQITLEMAEREKIQNKLQIAKEMAEEATRLKDKFVSLVAHDLRSPLSAVLGSIEYVVEDNHNSLNKIHEDLLESALSSGRNLMKLIEEVLNISRLKTGKITLEKKFFNARALVQEMSQRLDHLRFKKGLAITNEVPGEMRLYADRTLIGEVIQNLLSNAIKFSQPHTEIRISAQQGDQTVIMVTDQGMGISETMLPKLFNIEEKTSMLGTQGEQGTGFGLPFSYDIMQAHAGTLSVTSTIGQGSLFSLLLPAVHPRVLIVDDELILRTLLTQMLRPLHVEVFEAANGKDALKYTREHPIHLILSDVHMPLMGGFELLEELQKNKETKSIPFVLITIDQEVDTRDRAFRLGAADFAVKPLQPHDFLPRVRNYLGG